MITSKDAASLWLEASAMFQSTLDEVLTEWGKPEEQEAAGILSNVVNANPEMKARAEQDPDMIAALSQQEGINAEPTEQ